MTHTNVTSFEDELLTLALEMGCEAAETCFDQSESFTAKSLEGELDSYESSKGLGIGIRVVIGGKNGYAYTEACEDARGLVERAIDNARVIENEDERPMNSKTEYISVTRPKEPLTSLSTEEKIKLAMELERLAKSKDERVFQVSDAEISTGRSFRRLRNTLGLFAEREIEIGAAVLQTAVKADGETHDAFDIFTGSEALDIDRLASEVVKKATDRFGASSCAAGEYRVLMDSDAMRSLLGAFSPVFSADNVQKGLSVMKGRRGELVASELLTLADDPLCERNPMPFDGEGTPSVKKNVIDSGRLLTFLYDLKTAKKDGVASTANASKPSAASPVSIAPTNMYIVPGQDDRGAMIRALGNGIIVDELMGLHAGLNTISGDFSLLAKGFLVENGQIVRPVEQITIAGNFIDMLTDIERIGSDLKFGMPGSSMIGSPCVLIKKLTVSGSEE